MKIMEPPANMKHSSTIVVVMRQRGESDPRIQILQNCGSKNINGVTTPSLRTCPYCGALVQHTEACKNMTCPACSKGFCFVCLKPRKSDEVLQCTVFVQESLLLLLDKQVYQDDNGWITNSVLQYYVQFLTGVAWFWNDANVCTLHTLTCC